MNVGILGYGFYIPKYRLKTADIASVWGKNAQEVEKSLGVTEKAVASFDEDTVTLAYEAALLALKRASLKPSEIEACLVGSESHPYAVNPTSTIVAEFLGMGRDYLAVDLEFACKAATTGIISVAGLILAGKIAKGLVIGSDAAQSKPHDILEYTAACASAAYLLGKSDGVLAELIDFASFTSDTPDFWRRDGVRFPSHSGRFTGEPAYFTHVEGVSKKLLAKVSMKAGDFSYCVFHSPNGKFPRDVAKRLGFAEKQLNPSLIVDDIGNPYSASSLIGLAATLDVAKEGEYIFVASYGSGAGSDGFIFKTTKNISKRREERKAFTACVKNKKYLSYVDYLKFGKKI